MRVLLLAEPEEWHTRRLLAAFAARGVVPVVCRLSDCAIAAGVGGGGFAIPGFGDRLPDVVLVRSVAAGSFEQVTFRLTLLHALAEAGARVLNTARAIERAVDKGATSLILHRAGLPTPPCWVGEDPAAAAVALRDGERVVKPLFGSRGRGLLRLAPGEAPPPPEALEGGVFYLQRFVPSGPAGEAARDLRVFVVGGRAVAAMRRHAREDWVTNVARGGRCEAVPATGRLTELAVATAAAVGLDFAGVDLIEDAGGHPWVLEANSMPAWHGLQGVVEADIAAALVAHALDPA